MRHYGDITKLSGYILPVVDCITGGSPCQDLSCAGPRIGLDGARSSLFLHQIRIVKEMRQRDRENGRTGVLVRPRFMVWENVPGAFSSNEGRDFQKVLTEIVRIAEPEAPDVPMPPRGGWPHSGCLYDEMGRWSIAWRLHDAQFWGVPQRRKRISLVADFGGLAAPEVLFIRESLSRDLEQSAAARENTPTDAGNGADLAISIQGNTVDREAKQNGLGISEDKAHTLNGIDHHAVCAGFKYKASGSAKGIGYKEGVAPSLLAGQQVGVCYPDKARALTARLDGSPCIDRGPDVVCVYDARGNGDGKTVPTLTGDHGSRVTDYTALCVGNGQLGNMSMAPVSNTLDTMHDQQAVLVFAPDKAKTIKAKGYSDHREDSETYIVETTNDQAKLIVRRFTPLECDRLQGYPDDWTNIGDWIDSKGKKHKASDTPRYKADGNSIALPFWFWLLRRISAQYERPATLGSLFDGIGGFPLCWERCNGKGTAIWASEIEEFPIAVTKKHFKEETTDE